LSDVFSPEQRSAVMRRVRGRDTTPEMILRRLLRTMGHGYRLNRRDLPGSPDVVMAGRRLAIFVHGCFWHGHDCKRGDRQPKSNSAYWTAKIQRTRDRDRGALKALEGLGWRTLVIWECEMKDMGVLRARLSAVLGEEPASAAGGAEAAVAAPGVVEDRDLDP
jgi:DNA mismatch endonuclease (patch repair protein)